MLGDIVLQGGQVLTVLFQRGPGPSISQPPIGILPKSASWVFFSVPMAAFTAMLIVPTLIPVLANFPPLLSDMGNILGDSLIPTLGGFLMPIIILGSVFYLI